MRLARASLSAVLEHTPPPSLEAPTPALAQPSGVFVTLHHRGDLRGCVGTLSGDQSLYQNVARVAVSAAFDDPRFPPLTASELADVDIEVSRLTAMLPASPDEVVIGRHGICVVSGEHRGVLLPQVAPEHAWDRDRLLSEGCRKADLAPDAWRRGVIQLLTFEAEIFGDRPHHAR